jgi:exopolyphosphatase/guanosine-5'-triphosphate,3'-diphosphate pyrophosphatase
MNMINVRENGGYSIYDQASEMVRLSEGMSENKMLQPVPIQRTIKALEYFKQLLDVNGVTEVHALATAAVRNAANQELFLERIAFETGFQFRVLSGDEEAYYDFLGVVNSIELEDALIMDIGGGSTELIWMKNRRLKRAVSIPFGSVTLTERFQDIKPRKKRIEAAKKYFNALLDAFDWIGKVEGVRIVGLGGVLRTLAKIDRAENGHSIENMHNYRIQRPDMERICARILDAEDGTLDKIPGISKKRADIMTMGIIPFLVAMERVRPPEIRISGNGLRDGYFFETHFSENRMPLVVENVLVHSKENMMRRYTFNERHARHIKKLSLEIFDGLSTAGFEFQLADRKILSTAALLHDIGTHIEYYDHHIHGFYLILNGRLEGLTNGERISVAYLVGSHREASIKNRMIEFESIVNREEIQRLGCLTILLRLAEQLDRAENGVVEQISVRIEPDAVVFLLHAKQFPELEVNSAQRFADRFEKQYGKKLKFVHVTQAE